MVRAGAPETSAAARGTKEDPMYWHKICFFPFWSKAADKDAASVGVSPQ
jgi:hypothetical protein